MASSTRNLNLSLFRCNSTVGAEAARVYYRENIFAFHGDHEYLPVITWLGQIGEENRSNLTSLKMSVRSPSKAWQLPDGTRLKMSASEQFSPRHPHFAGPSGPCPQGEVDIIDPAIETIISIFTQSSNRKLKLYLNLEFDTIPGAGVGVEYFSMDLPNLIEKWRTDYTSGGDWRSLEVLWRAETWKGTFLERRALIEGQGWEILEEKEAQRFLPIQFAPDERFTYPTIQLLLKRKQLTVPLLAADPDLYSDVPGNT
ncbi:MAG: hypothetical protein Q9181_001021 [Wetmoreana brouardii]